MKVRIPVTICVSLLTFSATVEAKKQHHWVIGTVLDTGGDSVYTGSSVYMPGANGTVTANYVGIHTYVIQVGSYVYVAQQLLRWRWSKYVNLIVNGTAQVAIEDGKLYIATADGKATEATIVKTILKQANNSNESNSGSSQSVAAWNQVEPPLFPQIQVEQPPDRTFGNNHVSFDLTGRGLYYREIESGQVLDNELGPQVGGEVSGGFQQDWGISRIYFRGEFRMTQGTLTHGEANASFNGISTAGNIRNYNFRFGKGFGMGDHAQIVPYFGYGRRTWVRDTSNVSGGYYEQYDHNYAGAGALVQSGSRTVFSAYGFAGRTYGTRLAARNIPVGYQCFVFYGCFASNPSALDFTLGSGPLYMAGGSIDIGLGDHWRLNLGTDWSHFTYGRSIVQGGFQEPNSITDDLTAKIGVGYAF